MWQVTSFMSCRIVVVLDELSPHFPFHQSRTGEEVPKFDQKLIPFAKHSRVKPVAFLLFIFKIKV